MPDLENDSRDPAVPPEYEERVIHKPVVGDRTTPNPTVSGIECTHEEAMARYHRGWEHDRHNIERAYADMNFAAGFQWMPEIENQRLQDGRPVLTFNRMGQFIRQVTGDIRQMKPSIKVVPVNSGSDEKVAEIREGLIRHIEAMSNATLDVYVDGADSQVACGIGHWEVAGDYGSDTDYEQNIVVRTISDQIAVIWDPDSKKKTREDAQFCFVPVDMTHEAYKDAWPEHPVDDMGTWDGQFTDNWYDDDRVRVCRYWYKVRKVRKLVKLPSGTVHDVTDDANQAIAMQEMGGVLYEREGHEIYWRMMNVNEFLTEPMKWPGRYIPVVPIVGEEIKVGARIERHGIIRFAADAQRAYNYARSTQTEFVGLQPKAPFVGTEENFKNYAEEWETSNNKNWPYLRYTPDPKNGNIPPQRQSPPTTSPGLSECVATASMDMQATIGIYDASLGKKSPETSGVAIRAREAQGDTGTYVYMANFALALAHTGRIINDLIPHYYDTAREVRILGIDGRSKLVPINQPAQSIGLLGVPDDVLNDITAGTYDIQMEMGPSYATQREAAREGLTAFLQAYPPAAPVIADMVAELQDWPQKEKVVERLQTLLPPQIQAQLAQESGKPPPPPPEPNPVEMAKAQAEIAKAQGVASTSQLEIERKKLELVQQELANMKAELELKAVQQNVGTNLAMPPEQMKKFMDDTHAALQFVSDHLAEQLAARQPMEGAANNQAAMPPAGNTAGAQPTAQLIEREEPGEQPEPPEPTESE